MSVIVLRRLDAMKRVGLKASSFDQLRHNPDFPKPVFIRPRNPLWIEAEIDAWIAQRIAQQRGGK